MPANPLFDTLFAYKRWANDELYTLLRSLPAATHAEPLHNATRILNHIHVVDQIRRGDLPDRTRQALERDIYLYITDLDAVHADLQQRGANILHGPRMAPHGIREMVVEDLNHFRIAFGELG